MPGRSIREHTRTASLSFPSQDTVPQPSIIPCTSGEGKHCLGNVPVPARSHLISGHLLGCSLCELISLSQRGKCPCQAPTRACSRQLQDRQTVPELGTHCGDPSAPWQHRQSDPGPGKATLAAVAKCCHVQHGCRCCKGEMSPSACLWSQPAPSPCSGLLIRARAAKNPCQSLLKAYGISQISVKGPCRALKATKAGLLHGTWNFIPNAD